uniref:SCAN box domain-containing protein n=1 Tax=Amblyomma maculatum TaxID=34609 RepID=G3MTR4_AMBMU
MDKLKVQDLLEICQELGISVGPTKRKKPILELMRAEEVTEEEAGEAWKTVLERKKLEEKELERKKEAEQREHELQLKKLEIEALRISTGRSVSSGGQSKMKDLLQPFRVGEDIALFLVNFERTCEKVGFERDEWPQKLLTVLPCEASVVVARLSNDEAKDYDKVKAALLRKYRLSTEAFRQRFRNARKGTESHQEFAYEIRANMTEWLKSAGAYEDHDKVVECIGLEQFYRGISEEVRFWVQDRMTELSLDKAAELAEEYNIRRNVRPKLAKQEKSDRTDFVPRRLEGRRFSPPKNLEKAPPQALGSGTEGQAKSPNPAERSKSPDDNARAFEARRPVICYNCKERATWLEAAKRKSLCKHCRF